MSKGYVYFIKSEATNNIKIGRTKDITQRMNKLQIKFGKLTLLGFIEANVPATVERRIHKMFSSYHIENEWFRPVSEILNYIHSNDFVLPPTSLTEPENKMISQSIYIKKELYDRLQKAANRAGASLIITYLIEMWLDGKIIIDIQPNEQ